MASTQSLSYAYSNLQCGTSYTFGLVAYDAAGNRSNIAQATGTTSTAACSDATAPTAPSGLTKTGATATSVSLSWTASTDNTGVAGYRVYRDGALSVSTAATTHTVSGLACATSYAFAVEAYDAAANTSTRRTLTASTAPCPTDTTPPSVPQGMAFTGKTQTAV